MADARGSVRGMATFRNRVTGPGPAGDIWSCTVHTFGTVSGTTAHAAWNTFLSSVLGTLMEPLWSTETQATESITDQLSDITGKNEAQWRTTLDYKGTGSGLQLPQRSSVVIGLRTSVPTRSGRGRIYLPAPDSTNLTSDGLLSSTVAGNIADAVADALDTLGDVVTPGIYHRETRTITQILQVTVGQVLGTQRRRTNKVPPNYAVATV